MISATIRLMILALLSIAFSPFSITADLGFLGFWYAPLALFGLLGLFQFFDWPRRPGSAA